MAFLRRLLGGDRRVDETTIETVDDALIEADERARDLELLREDRARMSDLVIRQQRWAEYSWTPPAQGGERRADDVDGPTDEDAPTDGV